MTKMHYQIEPIGGCAWAVYIVDDNPELPVGDARQIVGTVTAGDLEDDGQSQWDAGEVLDAATDGPGCLVQDDGLPVFVDGIQVR